MKERKFELNKNEDYEMWTTINDKNADFGRIELEFRRPVSIIIGSNDEIKFHHCKHISSDKQRVNLSFYNSEMKEIVGGKIHCNIGYLTDGGVKKDLNLKKFKFKETLKSFFETEFGELNLSESELEDLCKYYDIFMYDMLDIKEELKSIRALTSYDMDFIDVDALAEDLHFIKINDDLWLDYNSLKSFEDFVEVEFEGDILKAIVEMNKSNDKNK